MKRRAPFIFLLIALFPVPAHAHPETGLLPDAIAEMEYQIVLDITPGDIKTRNKLGMVLCRKNKLKEAAGAFGEVLRASPNDFDAHNGMGLVRLKEKKPAEALIWLKKAAAINGEDTQVYGDLGAAYEQTGNLAQAESSYRKGLEVNASLIRRGVNKETENAKRTALQAALRNVQAKMKMAKETK